MGPLSRLASSAFGDEGTGPAPPMSDRAPFETPARLLIAEDEKLLARAMKRALERRGFAVDLASNGREAKDLLDQNAYAVLVLDLGMPIADGWSVLAHRRSLSTRPGVIVITGEDHRDLALQVMRAGASDVLRKPGSWRRART